MNYDNNPDWKILSELYLLNENKSIIDFFKFLWDTNNAKRNDLEFILHQPYMTKKFISINIVKTHLNDIRKNNYSELSNKIQTYLVIIKPIFKLNYLQWYLKIKLLTKSKMKNID